MRKQLLLIAALLFSVSAFSQNYNWGVGLRLGDPFGLTVMKPTSDNTAFEFNIGTSFFGWYGNYYNRGYFNDLDLNGRYVGSTSGRTVALRGHFLFKNDIGGVPGLRWYYGFGGQLRFTPVEVRYRAAYVDQWGNTQYRARHTVENRLDFGIGPDAVGGAEYTFEDVPITVFADLTFYMELFDDPFRFLVQPGAGGRWNF